jgi:hypothetical protein
VSQESRAAAIEEKRMPGPEQLQQDQLVARLLPVMLDLEVAARVDSFVSVLASTQKAVTGHCRGLAGPGPCVRAFRPWQWTKEPSKPTAGKPTLRSPNAPTAKTPAQIETRADLACGLCFLMGRCVSESTNKAAQNARCEQVNS